MIVSSAMRTPTIAVLIALFLPACLSRSLRGPAEDHYVLTAVVAQDCRENGFGQGKCTQEDFDALAKQARCIDAIAKRASCEDHPDEAVDTEESDGGN